MPSDKKDKNQFYMCGGVLTHECAAPIFGVSPEFFFEHF
jgi:hypothetical protein